MAGLFDPRIFDGAIFDLAGAPAGDPLPPGFLVAVVETRRRIAEVGGPVVALVTTTIRATQLE